MECVETGDSTRTELRQAVPGEGGLNEGIGCDRVRGDYVGGGSAASQTNRPVPV
jgi:hypothetical protein